MKGVRPRELAALVAAMKPVLQIVPVRTCKPASRMKRFGFRRRKPAPTNVVDELFNDEQRLRGTNKLGIMEKDAHRPPGQFERHL